jgi:hypothetical protein
MKQATKKLLVALVAAIVMTAAAAAQKAEITYTEGTATVKTTAGTTKKADIGGIVAYGESVTTGKDGLVELQLPNGSVIKMAQNSVFSYSSTGTDSAARPVLASVAGKISYKLKKGMGNSPVIQTNSMVAGVRGTEFTVYSGGDGSVLLAVTGGIVDVESQGTLVSLNKDEAVEVEPGKAPGEKYVWLGKEQDFSDWNTHKIDGFLADPVGGIDSVIAQLDGYQKELAALKGPYTDATAAWRAAQTEYDKIVAAGDDTAIKAYQTEKLFPARNARATIILNMRYHALNYLSVRRYVLSNMYMEMKSRYPLSQPPAVAAFFQEHAKALGSYEANIVPDLNGNDY